MDLPSLTSRLSALSLSSSSSSTTPLATYFFTPKSGSKHPTVPDADLKLVVIAIEENKNVGAAKAVAASVGLKDMRAVSAKDLETMLGRKREEGESREVGVGGCRLGRRGGRWTRREGEGGPGSARTSTASPEAELEGGLLDTVAAAVLALLHSAF